MTPTEQLIYRLKKWFPIYPGVVQAVSAEFLSAHYRKRRRARSVPRAALDVVIGAGFHLWAPLRARNVARKFGLGPEWRREATRIARARFADPNDIALFRISDPGELDMYMRRFEHAAINKRINPSGWRKGCALNDKLLFYRRCEAHGLPHPQLLATITDRSVEAFAAPATGELVVKPSRGEGGSGFEPLDYPGWEGGDVEQFRRFLAERAGRRRGTWIVQPRLSNHPAMRDLSLSALATVRVTTMVGETGAPEIVTSVLRFPSTADSKVDNIKAGGLMAPVDAETGTLGTACRGRGLGEFERHPVSGGEIAGRTLPFWEEARELVVRAHRAAFPEYTLVGWDVALTSSGPMLIEGNGKPCIIVAQRANRRGVGSTRFGELVAYHLEKTEQR